MRLQPANASCRRFVQRTLCVVALLAPTLSFADSRLEARRHFKSGMTLIVDGKLEKGVAELLSAYGIRPHPNVLFNIARAYETGGRLGEAIHFYNRYLEAKPPDADQVQQAVLRLEEERSKSFTG